MNVDLTTMAGMTAIIVGAISALKFALPEWTKEKEPRLAIALGLIVGILARIAKPATFPPFVEGWVAAIIQGIAAAMAAGLAHDKILNPVKQAADIPKRNDDVPKRDDVPK